MRILLIVIAALALVTGCATTIEGHAVAGPHSGLPVTGDGSGVVLGTPQDSGAAAIDLFIEPHCPHCGHFVEQYGDQIAKYLTTNRLPVTIRPLTFLDRGSDDYSARATNAIFLVAADPAATPVQVWKFVEGLYAKLLATRRTLDDDAIAQVANGVGASPSTVNAVAAGESAVDAGRVNEDNLAVMDDYGVEPSTPTVYDTVNKADVDFTASRWLDDLVR